MKKKAAKASPVTPQSGKQVASKPHRPRHGRPRRLIKPSVIAEDKGALPIRRDEFARFIRFLRRAMLQVLMETTKKARQMVDGHAVLTLVVSGLAGSLGGLAHSFCTPDPHQVHMPFGGPVEIGFIADLIIGFGAGMAILLITMSSDRSSSSTPLLRVVPMGLLAGFAGFNLFPSMSQQQVMSKLETQGSKLESQGEKQQTLEERMKKLQDEVDRAKKANEFVRLAEGKLALDADRSSEVVEALTKIDELNNEIKVLSQIATPTVEQAQKSQKNQKTVGMYAAKCTKGLEELKEVEKLLSQAIELLPKDREAYALMGKSYRRKYFYLRGLSGPKDDKMPLRSAIEYVEKAIEADPEYDRGYFNKACYLCLLGEDMRQATAQLQKAIDLFAPNYETGLYDSDLKAMVRDGKLEGIKRPPPTD